jgi:hypothetical protein
MDAAIPDTEPAGISSREFYKIRWPFQHRNIVYICLNRTALDFRFEVTGKLAGTTVQPDRNKQIFQQLPGLSGRGISRLSNNHAARLVPVLAVA